MAGFSSAFWAGNTNAAQSCTGELPHNGTTVRGEYPKTSSSMNIELHHSCVSGMIPCMGVADFLMETARITTNIKQLIIVMKSVQKLIEI